MVRMQTTVAIRTTVAAIAMIAAAGVHARDVTSARPIDSSEQCLPPSALTGADIVMLGQYGGQGVAVPYQIRGAQHGTRAVTVTGDPGRPVVLVLSAYESTVWDFSRVPAGRIRGVVASGFYAQGVIGLPRGVPVAMRHRSADNGPDRDVDPSACPDTSFAYSGSKVRSAAVAIRSSLGRYPVEFFGAYATAGYNLAGGPVPSYSDEPTGRLITERPVVTDGLRSGHEGLRQLVASGVLRPASSADMQRWHDQGAGFEPLNQMAAMRRLDGAIPSGSPASFLIARSVTRLPGGLDGAHSVTFLVPAGVSAPFGMQTHSQFYKITGLRGVPSTTAMSMDEADPFSRMMSRAGGGGGELHHARWHQDGTLISETPGQAARDSSEGPWQIGSLNSYASSFEPSRPRQNYNPVMVLEPRLSPDHSRDSSDPNVTLYTSLLLVIMGSAGLLLSRRKAGTSHDGPQTLARTSEEDHSTLPAAIQKDIDRVSQQLQDAIDASDDDETALVLIRFKRAVARAALQADYDGDIANDLDSIVERHMPETVSIYMKALRRADRSKVADLENNLRRSIQRLTQRIEDVLDAQSSRDLERLREQEAFIRSRHPDDELGERQ